MASEVDSVVGGARMGAGNVNPSKLSNTWKLSCLAVVVVTGAAVGRVSNLVAASVTGAASVSSSTALTDVLGVTILDLVPAGLDSIFLPELCLAGNDLNLSLETVCLGASTSSLSSLLA